jgi:hypothetical protein
METREERIERIAKVIGLQFFFLEELGNMNGKDFADRCRAAAANVVDDLEHSEPR